MDLKLSNAGGLILAVIAIAKPAYANESKFSFEMAHERVDGQKNGIEHRLDRGFLTVAGQLWITQCSSTVAVSSSVTIEVWEDTLIDHMLCSFGVSPSKKLGDKVSFSTTCAEVTTSRFYVVAWKDNSVCTVEAEGTLITK